MEDLGEVRLRGISNIEDTQMQMVHFAYGGEVYKLIMKVEDDLNSQLKLKIRQIKEMYEQEDEGNEAEQV
jgi:hypothetical protein